LHKARSTAKEQFRREVQSQIPVIEQAIETAAFMLGSDKSCGCCLEMISADFLAGAMTRFFRFLTPQRQRTLLGWPTTGSQRVRVRKGVYRGH
jgi:hypothetical protein